MAAAAPAHFVVFDMLAGDGEDLRPRPLRERREHLEALLADGPVQLPVCPQTADIAQATEWMTSWLQLGVEGLVAKRGDAPYLPGRRSSWVKIRARTTAEAIIGGVTGSMRRPVTLLVGRYDAYQRFRYAGRTRPLTPVEAAEVGAVLVPAGHGRQRTVLPWPQPLPARWGGQWGSAEPIAYQPVEPTVVAELDVDTAFELGKWRHAPRLVRLRPDLSPYDVPPHRSGCW